MGDIVCYFSGRRGTFVVHRIVKLSTGSAGRCVVKGDNSLLFDPPIPTDWLIGKVIAVSGPDTRFRRVTGISNKFISYFIAQVSLILPYLYRSYLALKKETET